MIRNGYYYPDWVWKNTPHKIERTGAFDGECAYAFIVGNRRGGKSVGTGIFAIADYLLFRYRSALIRRFDKNFRDSKAPAMQNFWMKSWQFREEFKDIVKSDQKLQEIYPLDLVESVDFTDHEIEFKDYHCYIDGDIFCYPVMLNKYDDNKNNVFDNVHKIFYDEFIPESGRSGLPDEFTAVANVYDTIARGRDDALKTTSVIFMANAVTNTNEFYRQLRIDREIRNDTKRIFRPEKGYCVEVVHNNIAEDAIVNSAFGKILQNSDAGKMYLGYSQNNIVKDDDSFVERIQGSCRYIMTIVYDNACYALKLSEDGLYYFTDEGVDENFNRKYALQKEDHSSGTVLVNQIVRQSLRYYKTNFEQGLMRFNSMRTKQIFLEIYHML